MDSFHEYSTTLSKALDTLGYSHDSIKARHAWWDELFSGINDKKQDPKCTIILAGSKAEGVTDWLESDTDIMGYLDTIVCCEDIQDVDPGRYQAMFVMDRDNVAPGYTRLRHVDFQKVRRSSQRDTLKNNVSSSFQNENGDFLLSSEFFNDQLKHEAFEGADRAGPALTETRNAIADFNIDQVLAIQLKCKCILQAWISRPRHHNWPSGEVIQEISTMDGHVVPVGVKGTDKQYEEWRICYTQAETTLIRSFNETQLKLYILLKMVAKKLLKLVCPDITSYVIKNIMFWLAEKIPGEMFRLEDLMGLLMLSLRTLIIQVDTECLENYMIPERNLFAGKLEQPQKQAVLELLASLIREGPTFILQYPELDVLRSRMVQVFTKPELALYEQKNREEASRRGDTDDNSITCIAAWNAFCADKGVDPNPIKVKLLKLLHGYYN